MFQDKMLDLLDRWESLSGEERMTALSELVASGELDDESMKMLHEMFLSEAALVDESVIETMVAAAFGDLVTAEVDAAMAAQADLPKYKQKSRRTITRQVREMLDEMMDADRVAFDALLNKHVATQEAELAARINSPKMRSPRAAKAADATVSSGTIINDDVSTTAASAKKRRPKNTRTAQSDAENLIKIAADLADKPKPKPKRKRKIRKVDGKVAQEVMLEFIESKDGALHLQEVGDDEPLVKIQFSDKVKQMLGEDVQVVGQAMIHAAIASVVQKQANFWHAHVYDEEPQRYS